MHIWTIANQKGGVGKTTTAVTLGGLLAEEGQRVLLLDLDPHGSLTVWFNCDPDSQQGSSYDLFAQQGKVAADLPASLVRKTSHPNLKFIPASTALAVLERKCIGVEGMGLMIARALALLRDEFDFVLIDNTPALGVLMINALAACQRILIPVQTEFLALKGLERMLHTLSMVMKSQKNDIPYNIVPTMFDRRTKESIQAFKTLRQDYREDSWRYAIPVDTKFRDASRLGEIPSICFPDTHGVRAYKSLLEDWLRDGGAGTQGDPANG